MEKLQKDSVNKIITKHIRISRNEKGIKYNWLANQLGISPSNLSHKLAKNGLYAEELICLILALELDINDIIEEVKQMVGDNDKCISNDLG